MISFNRQQNVYIKMTQIICPKRGWSTLTKGGKLTERVVIEITDKGEIVYFTYLFTLHK